MLNTILKSKVTVCWTFIVALQILTNGGVWLLQRFFLLSFSELLNILNSKISVLLLYFLCHIFLADEGLVDMRDHTSSSNSCSN